MSPSEIRFFRPRNFRKRSFSGTQFNPKFSLCNNLLAEIYFCFLLMKNRAFRKELSPSETHIFRPCDFGKRSFSEILDQCNFGKNGVWQKNSDSLPPHLLSKNTWTSAISEKTTYRRIRTRKILERFDFEFNSYFRKSKKQKSKKTSV